MFDLDTFVSDCRAAVTESEPIGAVRQLLADALANRSAVAAALPPDRAELSPIYSGTDVTIVKVVWGPRMTFPPHDHLTWACNGIYVGAEHNALFRLTADGSIEKTDVLDLEEGDVGVLGDDAIHSVTNPRSNQLSAAIHVYGGDFLALPRSNWIGDPPGRVRADVEQTRAMFEAANQDL